MRHWAFVLAAYGITAVVLLGYWRHVERRLAELAATRRTDAVGGAGAKGRRPSIDPAPLPPRWM
jgi:HAMP domain-containing protein